MKLSRITAFAIATLIGVSAIGAPAHANIFGKVLGIPNLGGIQHAKPARPNPMEVRGNCMQKAKVDKEYSMLLLKHSKKDYGIYGLGALPEIKKINARYDRAVSACVG